MRKRILILLLGALACLPSIGQQRSFVQKIIPDYAKVQFAGGIGLVSGGVGYESRNKKFQGDLMYGYVPESVGGVEIHSITGKFTWLPLSQKVGTDTRVQFLTAGVLVNYSFGSQYFLFNPENYPFDYYQYPTAMHLGIFIGGGINYKRIGLYYEAGTTDKELVSYVANNKSLAVSDIINLGFGIKFDF